MAMHNVALLTQENIDLRTAIKLQEHKRKRSKKAIIHNNSLNMEQAMSLIQTASIAASPTETSLQRKRAPPRCSNCHQIGHTRTSCTSRQL